MNDNKSYRQYKQESVNAALALDNIYVSGYQGGSSTENIYFELL